MHVVHLRRRRDRRIDCLFPEPPRRAGDRDRARRSGVRGVGQVGRLSGARLVRRNGVFGLKGHSLVFETGTSVPPEALFLEYREASGAAAAPEVFPRPDGTTYVCAISSESPLPEDPADVAPDPGAIERPQTMCARLSPALAQSKIIAAQAC